MSEINKCIAAFNEIYAGILSNYISESFARLPPVVSVIKKQVQKKKKKPKKAVHVWTKCLLRVPEHIVEICISSGGDSMFE